MTAAVALSRLQFADVPLQCACGHPHGSHYELRSTAFEGGGCDLCACVGLRWQELTAPNPEPVFDQYRALLKEQAALRPPEWTFKSNPVYQQFLEHVTAQQGERYLELIEQDFFAEARALDGILIRTALDNDQLGKPQQVLLRGALLSPTNYRYMHHALTFWRHVGKLKLKAVHVIEIGGGYGGLALYILRLAPTQATILRSYTIVDVPEAGPIQQAFARQCAFPLRTVDGTDRQALATAIENARGAPRVLVSAYGFSELSSELRAWYEDAVTRHCPHGFLVWNRCGVYPLAAAPMTVEDEPVLTEVGVKVVRY